MKKSISPIQQYVDVMAEIKKRMQVVNFFWSASGSNIAADLATESICLQLRKVLELIAFGSLVANKDLYSAVHKSFASHWNADLLLRDLERVNPNFYPVPLEQRPSTDPKVQMHHVPLVEGFLTPDEFVRAYKRCASMLHALNPYGSRASGHFFDKALPDWHDKIVALLNIHRITLVGRPEHWLIHMQEAGHEEVRGYTFAPITDP